MKTEKEIQDSIEHIMPNLLHALNVLSGEIEQKKWADAEQTCFILMINIAGIEAAEKILL